MVEFRILSEDEARAAGLYAAGVSIAVAEDGGRVVSMASFNTSFRSTMCSKCTGACSTGGIVWTAPDRRQEGLFIKLFNWAKAELGIDKVYISAFTPEQLAVAAVHNLAVPAPGTAPSAPPLTKAESTANILNAIQIIEEG